MHPTLFTLGKFTVSSFGLFLIIGFVLNIYVVWKLARSYEINEEKTLDILFMSFAGGFLFSRFFQVLTNYPLYDEPLKIVLINKYPGLSLWGALIGGLLVLWTFYKKFRLNFWQVGDFFMVGFIGTAALTSLGCLFAGCDAGLPSSLFFAVDQVGLIGKRFPIQILESIIFFAAFLLFYKQTLRFHFNGQIIAKGLIFLGIVRFLLAFFISQESRLPFNVVLNFVLPIIFVIFGMVIYYRKSKKSFRQDFVNLILIIFNPAKRKMAILQVKRSWYNFSVKWKLTLTGIRKNWRKKLNIRSNPTRF
jgi:phosphatidylglycerol---prolipoprotein diacylglyceryl transferase